MINTNTIKIAHRLIGKNKPVFIIAEIGINHNGRIEEAKWLIDQAAEAKADAVKFQKRDLKSLYKKEVLENTIKFEQSFQYMISVFRETELTEEAHKELKKYAESKGLIYLCTPWDKKSVDFLETLNVPAYKVASADLTNLELLDYLAKTKKPLIISSGMSEKEEIAKTVEFLKTKSVPFILLHCNASYPAPYQHLNLNFIEELKNFGVPVGYSGHERGIYPAIASVVLGAKIIEKHLTRDRKQKGPDHLASLEPEEFQELVKAIRIVETSLGKKEKYFTRPEVLNREVLGKSLVATRHIKKGEVIKKEDITTKSPAKGLSPQFFEKLAGKKAIRDIAQDNDFLLEDIGKVKETFPRLVWTKPWGLKVRFQDLKEIQHLQPVCVEFHLSDEDMKFQEAPPQLSKTQLMLHAPEYWYGRMVDLAHENKEKRNEAIKIAQATIEMAKKLQKYFSQDKKPFIIMHPGGYSEDEPIKNLDSLEQRVIDSLNKLNLESVEFLIENMPPYPWFFGGQWFSNLLIDADRLQKFHQQTGFNICLDLSHAKLYCNAYQKDFWQYLQTTLPFAKHLHLADAKGVDGEGLQIEEGEIDWKKAVLLIKKFNPSFVPEIWRGHLNNFEGFLLALARLHKYLEK